MHYLVCLLLPLRDTVITMGAHKGLTTETVFLWVRKLPFSEVNLEITKGKKKVFGRGTEVFFRCSADEVGKSFAVCVQTLIKELNSFISEVF